MLRVLAICALASCYQRGGYDSCLLQCSTSEADSCPNGLSCSNGFCAGQGEACTSDGGVIPIDAPSDSETSMPCYGEAPVRVCFDQPPTGMLAPGLKLRTTDMQCPDIRSLPGIGEVCVFAAGEVLIAGTTEIDGPRPAILIGVSTITITTTGTLDVGSTTLPARAGAGSQPLNVCPLFQASQLAQGGAGGSFVTSGGRGGNSGPLAGTALEAAFHGGCAGGAGAGGSAGPGGFGGGAVYLIADGQLRIDGTILAGGAGGSGGGGESGGGGGGSGGYIGLDSPTIIFGALASVLAGGGGGGGGADAATIGTVGLSPARGRVRGTGGAAGGNGGRGGDGGIGNAGMAGGNAESPQAGGGGGGGGVGVIQIFRSIDGCGNPCTPSVPPGP